MWHSMAHLESVTSDWELMQFSFTEFQQFFLELHSALDYTEIYKPRMHPSSTSSRQKPVFAPTMGVFTWDLHIVERMLSTNLPVYFLRCTSSLPADMIILKQLTPIHPQSGVICTSRNPGFDILYSGPSSSDHHLYLVHCFTQA